MGGWSDRHALGLAPDGDRSGHCIRRGVDHRHGVGPGAGIRDIDLAAVRGHRPALVDDRHLYGVIARRAGRLRLGDHDRARGALRDPRRHP